MIRSQEKDNKLMALDVAEEIEEESKDGKPKIYTIDDLDSIPDTEYAPGFEIDEEADAFSSAPPPDAGVYAFATGLGDYGVQIKQTSLGVKYHSVSLEFSLVDDNPNLAGATVRSTLSTNIGRSKGTSTLATFLNRNNMKVQGAVSGKAQLALLKKFILSEALTYLNVDWEASYKDEVGKYIKTKSKQKDFQKDKEGKWIYRFEKKLSNGAITNYSARLFVVDYFGASPNRPVKGEQAKVKASSGLATFDLKTNNDMSAEDLEKDI